MTHPYEPATLASAAADARNWTDLIRLLGLPQSGGQRRVLQEKVAACGIDTGHFKQRSPWRRYSDEAIATAAAASTSLRELAEKLGAPPATGTLSHLARRLVALGLDVRHFPGLNRVAVDLPFTADELRTAAASADSTRGAARALGVPDDSRSRQALGRMLREHGIDTAHFRNARLVVADEALRSAVAEATGYADVMRTLGLQVTDTNHRRVRRQAARLGLDTSHFVRRAWGTVAAPRPRRPSAPDTLVVRPEGSPRTNRARLHRALQETGRPYGCVMCANPGEWLGQPITLQIDHINGDWLDNRPENLRYVCPNCHALTDTWCRGRRSRPVAPVTTAPVE
ncbi:HNH endonuclease [Streptomyces sp. NPDC058655]|uniref:HNH endonuclease signature motif containing protein n=1 Tax=Streptomyces sp. NPDC058655 TaxID=3346577 RepID=UPI003660FB95